MKKMVHAARLLPTLVCAWCKLVMKAGSPKVSHGICRGCAAHWFGRPARVRLPGQAPA
jgi:hypothetical protein